MGEGNRGEGNRGQSFCNWLMDLCFETRGRGRQTGASALLSCAEPALCGKLRAVKNFWANPIFRSRYLFSMVAGLLLAASFPKMSVAGLASGLALGLLIGVLAIIPVLGAATGFILAISFAALQYGTWTKMIAI